MSTNINDNDDSGEDDEDPDIIQYGYRTSRRRTPHEYRGSSSLTPAQIMEQETYYRYAEVAVQHVTYILQLILLYKASYVSLCASITRLSGIASMEGAVAIAREKFERIMAAVNWLFILVRWTKAHGEVALLYAEDLAIFIRRRHRFTPCRSRRIDDVLHQDCYTWFGYYPHNLSRLYLHLRVPETFVVTATGKIYMGEECFLVYLYHLTKGTPFTEMARFIFGGDPRRLSEMNRLFINHLYFTFYNKISGDSMSHWIPRSLHACRRLIYDALSSDAIEEVEYLNGELVDRRWILHHFQFDSFCIFGFLDDFAMPTARPGSSATRRYDFDSDIQRAFYSGYLRRHGLKAQVVYLPIGIIGSVFITEIRQNDSGVLNMSGLNDYLVGLLTGHLVGQLFPCLYCDGIFANLATIVPRYTNPTPEERLLNLKLASQRQCIEHVFGDHRNRFKLFSVPHYLRLFNQGVMVRRECLASFFMLNCQYCLDGTRSRYFGHAAPTIEEYLPLNERLHPPPAVDLGPIYNFNDVV